ncbi:MAG: threonylcarbamoyl-AMP synthase, partial [Firmicutes bacterium]|nr:threonylcarbamoyl-AMP synthase [Candidatus Stercoripulliclostridium pullicola]
MSSVDKVINKSYDTLVGGAELLDEAAEYIRRGELVAFPTETVYGLGADAFNEEAVKCIFIAKGRPQDNPFIVHVASPEGAKAAVSHIPDEAYRLWEKFSPGPLTIVLPKSERMPLITTGGLQTVGIRIPNNRIALELIRRSGCAIAAPSANTSGRISPTRAIDVYEDMRGRIPLILDGGQTDVGIESTVIDLTREVPTVLRPGAITAGMLAEVLGEVVNHKG